MNEAQKKHIKMIMNITKDYVEDMMGELIKVVEESKVEVFTKEEVITILKVHSKESQIRILASMK